jgi:hypothetical protein
MFVFIWYFNLPVAYSSDNHRLLSAHDTVFMLEVVETLSREASQSQSHISILPSKEPVIARFLFGNGHTLEFVRSGVDQGMYVHMNVL